jgi:hypothetical protein
MSEVHPVSLGIRDRPPLASGFTWKNLKARETGSLLDSAMYSKISIQIEGEFGGATVQIEGSNGGKTWHVLIDSQDNHLNVSFPGLADIGQLSRYIRPTVIGGSVELTNISIFAVCKGAA